MPVDFTCNECGGLLQIDDGEPPIEQLECQHCGAVVGVPPGFSDQLPDADPTQHLNPFASPEDVRDRHPELSSAAANSHEGPPWERDGPSARSFLATAMHMMASPHVAYRTMRREGGVRLPTFYCAIGQTLGWVSLVAAQVFFSFVKNGDINAVGLRSSIDWVFMLLSAVVISVAAAAIALLHAGILHLAMKALGSTSRPFETTYRAVAYAMGTSGAFSVLPLYLIPRVGLIIPLILAVVLCGVGLRELHETTPEKAMSAIVITVIVLSCIIGGLTSLFLATAVFSSLPHTHW